MNKLHLKIASLFESQQQGKKLSLDQEFLIAAVLENQHEKFAEVSEKANALGEGFTYKMLTYVWDYMRNSFGQGYETAFSIRVEDMIIDRFDGDYEMAYHAEEEVEDEMDKQIKNSSGVLYEGYKKELVKILTHYFNQPA
ncbi:hypothetical protein N9V61_05255 [Flavobacteriaceae bacterium]|uniref:hypothetical protein n=1 Tax=Candidatus Arcticimaribacter forsetii TaxID=2820661 RepID=UPI00207773F9|nr:hypothetical protein [Candidatus Arcticimaribacter forsetii]MCH1538834.1 hypothetical protein [Flavobacteriaceae bacterium]MDB2325983.1 hypothetical protein [Flavobacteriaceae bacterium]MDB2329940.1 hypothetical protein [Flavobacteriaceae bacterium]MDB2346208.1 hypothetical protein [Flavobacteriaceae bacterium]MDB4674525.1 hypothetical protein [Flavobacteriaceae bacterium]